MTDANASTRRRPSVAMEGGHGAESVTAWMPNFDVRFVWPIGVRSEVQRLAAPRVDPPARGYGLERASLSITLVSASLSRARESEPPPGPSRIPRRAGKHTIERSAAA